MKIGDKAWHIYCGGMTPITLIDSKPEAWRVQDKDGKKYWVRKDHIVEDKDVSPVPPVLRITEKIK